MAEAQVTTDGQRTDSDSYDALDFDVVSLNEELVAVNRC